MNNLDQKYKKIENKMNGSNRDHRYFSLLYSKRDQHSPDDLNKQIKKLLKTHPDFRMARKIDWEGDQEAQEENFKLFAIHRFTESMAYSDTIMSPLKAQRYLSEILADFDNTRKFYTNSGDIDKTKSNTNSWTPVTINTFDCCLIIADSKNLLAIIMVDED